MPRRRFYFLIMGGLIGMAVLSGCSNTAPVIYRPLKNLSELNFPTGAAIGVARPVDAREGIDSGSRSSQSNVLAETASEMHLTYGSEEGIPVAGLVHDILSRELKNGGMTVRKLSTLPGTDLPALRAAVAGSDVDYLVGGSVETFQLTAPRDSTSGLYCVLSVVLRMSMVDSEGAVLLENERIESYFHDMIRPEQFYPAQNADKLVNNTLRNAIRQLLRRMAARLEAIRTRNS